MPVSKFEMQLVIRHQEKRAVSVSVQPVSDQPVRILGRANL